MKKSISRIIGVIMLIVAIVFIVFALNHRKLYRRTFSGRSTPDKRIPPRTLPILGRCPRRLFCI